jgi:hypothetical protein
MPPSAIAMSVHASHVLREDALAVIVRLRVAV